MELTDILQSIGIFIAFLGIIIAIYYNYKQIKLLKDQMRLNFFADYTKRYQEIMLNFPDNIGSSKFDFNDLPSVERSRTYRYMRAYFDLCSEEYELYLLGHIDPKIWKNWEQGINSSLSKKAFKKGWKHISLNSYYYPDFTDYITKLISSQKKLKK